MADSQLEDVVGQVHRVGGVAQLVIDNGDLVVGLAQADHGLDKVFSVVAVQPGGAHDEMAAAEPLDILLAQQLGLAVGRDGRGHGALVQGDAAVGDTGEHIVRRNMDQAGVDLLTGQGQVAGPQGVDLVGRIAGGLAAVHIGESRAVDDSLRLVAADIVDGRFTVGDVQFIHIHGDDSGLAQPLRQRAEDAALGSQLLLQLGTQLAAAAGN